MFHLDASLWLAYALFPLQTGTFSSALKERATIWFCNVKTIIALRKRITELSVPSVYAFNKHSVSKRIECLFVLWCFPTTALEFLYLNVWETCFYKFTETWQTVGICSLFCRDGQIPEELVDFMLAASLWARRLSFLRTRFMEGE